MTDSMGIPRAGDLKWTIAVEKKSGGLPKAGKGHPTPKDYSESAHHLRRRGSFTEEREAGKGPRTPV